MINNKLENLSIIFATIAFITDAYKTDAYTTDCLFKFDYHAFYKVFCIKTDTLHNEEEILNLLNKLVDANILTQIDAETYEVLDIRF